MNGLSPWSQRWHGDASSTHMQARFHPFFCSPHPSNRKAYWFYLQSTSQTLPFSHLPCYHLSLTQIPCYYPFLTQIAAMACCLLFLPGPPSQGSDQCHCVESTIRRPHAWGSLLCGGGLDALNKFILNLCFQVKPDGTNLHALGVWNLMGGNVSCCLMDKHEWVGMGFMSSLCVSMYVRVQSLQLCLTVCNPWMQPTQAPLFMGFPRQEYWSGLSCLPPGDPPNPGIKSASPAGRFFPAKPPGKPLCMTISCQMSKKWVRTCVDRDEQGHLRVKHVLRAGSPVYMEGGV